MSSPSMITGWQDVFLTQTMDQYRQLRDRGTETALVVGPWTHAGGGDVVRESLRWLDGDRHAGSCSHAWRLQPPGYRCFVKWGSRARLLLLCTRFHVSRMRV